MQIDFTEFCKKCSSGKCMRGTIYNKKTCLREVKQKRCYGKWLEKQDKKEYKVDERWEEVKKIVWERDKGYCRLLHKLTKPEFYSLDVTSSYLQSQPLDLAHVVRRSQSKKLYYEPRNIVLLNRVFHSRLDQYKNPLTGKSDKEIIPWWIRIVGEEEWNWLQENL